MKREPCGEGQHTPPHYLLLVARRHHAQWPCLLDEKPPSSLSFSSQLGCSSPFTIFIALHSTRSTKSKPFFHWGALSWTQVLSRPKSGSLLHSPPGCMVPIAPRGSPHATVSPSHGVTNRSLGGRPQATSSSSCRAHGDPCRGSRHHHPPCCGVPAPPGHGTPSHHPSALRAHSKPLL